MNTAACDSCGDVAPEPLLRNVSLVVDSDRVDGQTLCPACFSDWIQRYQNEMATTMLQSTSDDEPDVGNDITIAEEAEPSPNLGTGSNVFDQAVANAGLTDDPDSEDPASKSDRSRGNEITEVGGKPPEGPGSTDEMAVDPDTESENSDEDDDSGGFF